MAVSKIDSAGDISHPFLIDFSIQTATKQFKKVGVCGNRPCCH